MTQGEKMCSGLARWKLGVITTLLGLFLGSNIATSQTAYIMPPMHSPLDKNGVNLATGKFQRSSALLSLGNPEFSGITVTEQWYGTGGAGSRGTNSLANYLESIIYNGAYFLGYNASYNGRRYYFSPYDGHSYRADGASLSVDSANYVYTMTTSDGTVVQYSARADLSDPTHSSRTAVATQVTEPNGRVTRFVYKWLDQGAEGSRFWPVSAANNLGYQIRVIDTLQGQGTSGYGYRISALKGINGSVEYCDRLALTCPSLSNTWPTVSYAYQVNGYNIPTRVTVTDAAGAITSYSFQSGVGSPGSLVAIKTPASATDNIWIGYQSQLSCVNGYSDGVSTYTYNFSCVTGGTTSGTITGPGGYRHTVTGNDYSSFLLTDQDALGRTTSYTQDAYYRMTKISRPEGNSENWVYDDRGNITEYRAIEKTGPGPNDIVLTAGYDATCTSATKYTCNKPNWFKDAKGNQTDFTYAPEHGGLLTETRPPDANGIRPMTRYAYEKRFAYVKNAGGTYSKAESEVWVKTEERTCRMGHTVGTPATGYSCQSGAQYEVVITYDYGPNYGSGTPQGPNNLLLRGIAVTADGQVRRTCFGYDKYGNKISETKPMANLGSCP